MFKAGGQELLGWRVIRLELQSLVELFDRLIVLARVVKIHSQFKTHIG